MKNDYICKHNNGLFRLLIGNRPLSNWWTMKSPITNEKTEETMETKQDQQPLTYPETTVAPWTAAVLSDVKTIIAQGFF